MRLQVALLFLVTTEAKKKKENDDEVISNVDVFPAPFPHPVPFGHIFTDGIGDVMPGQKQPLDPLELRLLTPKREVKEKYFKMVPKQYIAKLPPPEATTEQDAYRRLNIMADNDELDETEVINKGGNKTRKPIDRPAWFHFEKILDQNVKTPRPALSLKPKKPENETTAESPRETDNTKFFSENDFGLLKDQDTLALYEHWPTCDQFEKKTRTFVPKDIVDIDWVPFYVWTTRRFVVSIVHRFSFPTKKAVLEYKQTYGPYLNQTVDWESPKLLLQEQIEMLLIAADRNGLFYGIPKIKLPYGIRYVKNPLLPVSTLRIKIEDPYLALMYCDDYYATIMAAPGAEPQTDEEKKDEASILNIKFSGFPISRDLYLEELKMKKEIERKMDLEETKYIKAIDTGFDIERE